ncbi:Uma2 family endonuclease [Geminocystis herdmanii]|uniref:Uma2 family endonuclease n=1 Tax=Geminocystis herdmanii TaxID=669359 RepID=UPI00036FBF94|nr:Uma2 family endonuclease [Geminocystis herdmanii]
MTQLLSKIDCDTWVNATWDEYQGAENNPDYNKAKIYYHQGKIKIEMSPLGLEHSRDHSIISNAINLYSVLKGINLNCQDNCTYRKTGVRSAQPDLSYYIGENVDVVPYGTGIVDLDIYPPPNLVIEIANNSLGDDLGIKRLLYENFGTQEYWIVDVQSQKIIAFAINDGGSKKINQSQVLLNLELSILEEALQKTRVSNHSQVGAWLLQKFST